MRVVTYLGFTVLSIFIQFCVMDFIQDKIHTNDNAVEGNITYKIKNIDDLLKNITSKPHALYYKTLKKSAKRSAGVSHFSEIIYSNSTISSVAIGTTDISTTILDILYDESTSEAETTTIAETLLTTTEFDNVTEITFFDTKNKTSTLPKTVPKISFNKYCDCNLLFQVCDINCCCDQDCTHDEQKEFQCEANNQKHPTACVSYLLDNDLRYGSSSIDNWLCVIKTNLPEKRSLKKVNLVTTSLYNKWKHIQHRHPLYEFKKTPYMQADPIWLLKNATIYYLDFPTPMINNYCTDRAPIAFLKAEKIRCLVKFNDLEMFHISKTEDSMVISATERTLNSSTLNCSNLHCVNWTILACDDGVCKTFNKSLHEASCTESGCRNVALKIDYNFFYHDLKIINATIKLHIQKILPIVLPFLLQEVTVNFIMANKSLDHVIKFSGNPGYINYLPIIISCAKSNFTDNFFNNTDKQFLNFPLNVNGLCVLSNSPQNVVKFGLNKRTKCRYVETFENVTKNDTNVCRNIQDNINIFLGLNKDLFVSPFGNPYEIKDEHWLKLQTEIQEREPVYGRYSENGSKLYCYNLVNRVSFTFLFASVNENGLIGQNKILSAKYEVVAINNSFSVEDLSIVLTIDISFIDATKPSLFVYAGSPHLNIHLPKDFFFPFPPNNCLPVSSSYIVTISCVLLLFSNKITLE